MNKGIQILNTIFELELKPPFKLRPFCDKIRGFVPCEWCYVVNKDSEIVGFYIENEHRFQVYQRKGDSCLGKIKQVFNTESFSDEDIFRIIAKHLFNWLQDKFPEKLKIMTIEVTAIQGTIRYPNND